jgi:ABC-type nitrate/sulfonate/bicarbonate transport system substrate-binding protein
MNRQMLVAVSAVAVAVITAVVVLMLSSGGRPAAPGPAWPDSANPGEAAGPVTVRLGFVADIPQAPALIGLQEGLFTNDLHGTGIVLRSVLFHSDSAEATALAGGQLDAAYVTADSILTDLAGSHSTKIAVISGASAGSSPVNLVVTRAFLSAHSAGVLALVKGQVQANDLINHDLLESAAAYTAESAALTGQSLTASSAAASLARIRFTDDPSAASLAAMVPSSLSSVVRPALPTLYDVGPLDLQLRMAGERPVEV